MNDDEYDYGEPRMPDPDWDRYIVRSRAVNTGGPFPPIGDGTRWGGQIQQLVTSPTPALGLISPQFARGQTEDTYGRLWALVGTVKTTSLLWGLPTTDWGCQLQLTAGSGQATVVQSFDLRTLTTLGLSTGYARYITPDGFDTRSFAIIGGIIGQNWNLAAAQFSSLGGGVLIDVPVTITVIAAVLAAGSKL